MGRLRQVRPALAAFLLMMAMALTTTGLSFFVGPVCTELGLGRGAFTVYYSIMTFAGTIVSPILGRILQRRGAGWVAGVSGVWTGAGLFGFSLCRELWMFYLAAALTGVFGTACVTLCAGVIVQTHYRGGKASRLTGIVMAGSGAGGLIVSMALPGLIEALGWRTGYRLSALAWLLLGWSAAWLLHGIPACPDQEGTGEDKGMTGSQAMRSPKLYLLILVIFLLSAASGVQQQLPSVLEGAGLETSLVSGAMSFFTAALAIGKIAQGMLYGRLGPARGGIGLVSIYICGFALLGQGILGPGLLALAVGMGTVTTLMPIAARSVFGGREYAAIWSILSAVSNLGAMTAAPLFGMAFDLTGSYAGAMGAAAVLLVPALLGFMGVFQMEQNRKRSFLCGALVLILFLGILRGIHPSDRYDDRLVLGNTEEAIVEEFGPFSKTSHNEAGEITCGVYQIRENTPELIMSYDDSLWYVIWFEDGIAVDVKRQEGWYGG